MMKFIAISGTTGVTQNMYVYESEHDMVVVDCGVGFPEPEMYGVDLVIPDFGYIRQNSKKLKAVLISHGHEDHMGGLPFFFREFSVPIYATKLVSGFIKDKLFDYGVKNTDLKVFDPEKDTLNIGTFKIAPFRVSHSVPDGVGFMIETPQGKIFHVPDYKFDWTPVDAKPFDMTRASVLASGGALALASDCLGATTEGYTESEAAIEERIFRLVEKVEGKVFFTTISSNISRIKQAIEVARRVGRKVVFIGRSIDKKAQIARELGYLDYPSGLVISRKDIKNYENRDLMYIISGSYGQPGSALYRISLNEHEFLKVEKQDVVVFSSDPAPPGSKTNVDFVVDRLFGLGADVHYYDIQENLHVSGHGSIEDIKMLMALIKPKYAIPIGGTIRHMRAYSEIAQQMGISRKNVFELLSGEVVEFRPEQARLAKRIPVKDIMIDGLGIGDVGNMVLRDRQILAREGIVMAMIRLDSTNLSMISTPEIISRGFVYEGKDRKLLEAAGMELKKNIERRKAMDKREIKDITTDFLEKFFFRVTGRRPMIVPVIVEV